MLLVKIIIIFYVNCKIRSTNLLQVVCVVCILIQFTLYVIHTKNRVDKMLYYFWDLNNLLLMNSYIISLRYHKQSVWIIHGLNALLKKLLATKYQTIKLIVIRIQFTPIHSYQNILRCKQNEMHLPFVIEKIIELKYLEQWIMNVVCRWYYYRNQDFKKVIKLYNILR